MIPVKDKRMSNRLLMQSLYIEEASYRVLVLVPIPILILILIPAQHTCSGADLRC